MTTTPAITRTSRADQPEPVPAFLNGRTFEDFEQFRRLATSGGATLAVHPGQAFKVWVPNSREAGWNLRAERTHFSAQIPADLPPLAGAKPGHWMEFRAKNSPEGSKETMEFAYSSLQPGASDKFSFTLQIAPWV